MRASPEERTAPPDGLLLVDKPAGVTSHDVIAVARRTLGIERIGHAGTLDPPATGLLLLLVGRATRLLPYIEAEPKGYDAEIRFGAETDTDDATGKVAREDAIPAAPQVFDAIERLTGEVLQVPPAFSAKQRGGTRAYRAARKGRPITMEPAPVRVYEWRGAEYTDGVLRAHIVCGGGTYVRALARDIGRLCGSAAHLQSLRRTTIGAFSVNDAVPMRKLDATDHHILPPIDALPTLHRVILNKEYEKMIVHGRRIPAEPGDERVALLGAAGNLVAIAEFADGDWKPRVVLVDA